jgi:hypothetical protein
MPEYIVEQDHQETRKRQLPLQPEKEEEARLIQLYNGMGFASNLIFTEALVLLKELCEKALQIYGVHDPYTKKDAHQTIVCINIIEFGVSDSIS